MPTPTTARRDRRLAPARSLLAPEAAARAVAEGAALSEAAALAEALAL